MATLFQRVALSSEDDKIAISMVRGCLSEINRGAMAINRAADLMSLDSAQTDDLASVLTNAQASSNSGIFAERVVYFLMLAEMGVSEYLDETKFWNMIAEEGLK